MNVRACEYLIAIAEQGTLSRAARKLGVSQPTLSNFLNNTECDLGKTLFYRSGKVMALTEAGRVYLEYCRRILEVKERTYHSIASLCNQYSEHFTVGVTPHRGSTTFSQIFGQFCQRWPGVRVDLKEGYMETLLEGIDNGEIDLALGTSDNTQMEQYNFISQSKDELLLCVPDFHPLAGLAFSQGGHHTSIDIHRFQDTPFVMYGLQTTANRLIENFMQEAGMTPTVVYRSNNVLLIDTMLASGAGVGFLPGAFCKEGQGRVYFSMQPPLFSMVGIFSRKGRPLSSAQRYFCYLIIRNRLVDPSINVPALNPQAQAIFDEFKEDDYGHPSA